VTPPARGTALVRSATRLPTATAMARRLVEALGGRYSSELGIDVDASDAQVERWFLAATLFGTRISAAVAQRTFHVLEAAGLNRIAQARHVSWEALVALLDQGGYTRYDFRTATRLQELSDAVHERFGDDVAEIGRRYRSYPELSAQLDALPGWGPVTVRLFLRELRGVWPGAAPPLDERAGAGARHLGLLEQHGRRDPLEVITTLARRAGLDRRDLESALVRLTLAHGHQHCPGGAACTLLMPP